MGDSMDKMTECGTFTDCGFGFHEREDDGIRYMMAWPVEGLDGHWAVLSGSYSLDNEDREDFCDEEYLDGVLEPYGFGSIGNLQEACEGEWREMLTRCIASEQEGSRYAVPNIYSSEKAVIDAFESAGVPAGTVAGLIAEVLHKGHLDRSGVEQGIDALAESARQGSESVNAAHSEVSPEQAR